MPLATEQVKVFDDRGALITEVGRAPASPVLRRSHLLYDATRVAGRVEVSDSLRGTLTGSALASVLGVLLGSSVFFALRILPLRALRRVTGALFEQTQRAEVTSCSIGDAVITTDAQARVEFLNPVAEQLSGWALHQARGRPLAEILLRVDAMTGIPESSPMRLALAENRIVLFGRRQARVHSLPPESICFEINETMAINNLRNAADFIRERKVMGFLFALDAFGTGTSSFGYLKTLSVDYRKIDGGFVKNLEHDEIDKAMTETINRIGHIMGINTIAEYAE